MPENYRENLVLSQNKTWDNNENGIWLASTISLSRNIEKFKFPVKLDGDRQKQIISAINKEFQSSDKLVNPKLVRADEISSLQKEYLVEHFLTTQSFHQAHSGEAFIVDDSGEFLAILNIRDHIQLLLIDCRGELESTWNHLIQLEMALGRTVSYAFSQKYGFLTSDFTLCGTGLVVSVFLQLPGLVHSEKIDEVLEKLNDDALFISGIQGNPTEIIGDVIVVSNNYTLGVTEENTIALLRSFTTKILLEEHGARSKILHEDNGEIKDRVSRAYGVLIHSYQIEAVEALNAISLLKLGAELGWMKGTTTKELNRLFFNCRRAHLLHQCGEKIKQEEIAHKRAAYIHQNLKGVELTI
jgi:protein arginine kinase